MLLKETLEKLQSDFKFRQFIKENEKSYLCHFFMMMDADVKNDWQIGYYNPETNMVTMYTVTKSEITAEEPSEPFKEPDSKVEKLDFEKIDVDYDTAIQTAKKCLQGNYPQSVTTKILVLLQNLKQVGTVWNITFITAKYDTINVKINAIGQHKIISHEQKSLIGFDPKEFEQQEEPSGENEMMEDFDE